MRNGFRLLVVRRLPARMIFEIHSFEGALPLRFGMSPEEIESALGAPRVRSRNRKKHLRLSYDTFDVGFTPDDGSANHFGFGRGSSVTFRGIAFFTDPTAWRGLLSISSDVALCYGVLVFSDLGISLGGFHDGYDDELAVTAFPRGAFEHLRSSFTPYEPTGCA
jgi:hypothetical protein